MSKNLGFYQPWHIYRIDLQPPWTSQTLVADKNAPIITAVAYVFLEQINDDDDDASSLGQSFIYVKWFAELFTLQLRCISVFWSINSSTLALPSNDTPQGRYI